MEDKLRFPDYRKEAVDQFIEDENRRNVTRAKFSLDKIKEISDGFIGLGKDMAGLSTEEEYELANARMAICNVCPSKNGSRCGECGCILAAKTRSVTSDCPLNKWSKK